MLLPYPLDVSLENSDEIAMALESEAIDFPWKLDTPSFHPYPPLIHRIHTYINR